MASVSHANSLANTTGGFGPACLAHVTIGKILVATGRFPLRADDGRVANVLRAGAPLPPAHGVRYSAHALWCSDRHAHCSLFLASHYP